MRTATLTITLADDKLERLQSMAADRGISLHELIEELSTAVLAEFDAFRRFQELTKNIDGDAGLKLLDKLDSSETFDVA